MRVLKSRFELNLIQLERVTNLFNMNVEALIRPENGEGQLSGEDRIEAIKQQINAFEEAILDLKKVFESAILEIILFLHSDF